MALNVKIASDVVQRTEVPLVASPSARTRLLFVLPSEVRGGAEEVVLSLLRGWHRWMCERWLCSRVAGSTSMRSSL
jgi:hypothetical protein